tara:strand:+ start:3415 stop:3615 length:201 start_codon:yes stop_codon:yes gene_type:complete
MNNSKIINSFIKDKGVTRGKLAKLLGIDRKTLYRMIYKPGVRGISLNRKAKLNKVFKEYNYLKEIK